MEFTDNVLRIRTNPLMLTERQEMNTPMLYPLEAVQAMLGVGRTSIYELIGQGELVTVKIGRRTLVPGDEIENFVVRLRQKSAPGSAATQPEALKSNPIEYQEAFSENETITKPEIQPISN